MSMEFDPREWNGEKRLDFVASLTQSIGVLGAGMAVGALVALDRANQALCGGTNSINSECFNALRGVAKSFAEPVVIVAMVLLLAGVYLGSKVEA